MKILNIVILTVFFCSNLISQSSFFPLDPGKVYTLKYSETFNDKDEDQMLKTEVLSETEQINGKEYAVVETSYGPDGNYTVVSLIYMRTSEDGSIVTLNTKDQSKEQLFLSYPLEVGKTWENVTETYSTTIKIVDLNGSITTPNKTYTNCLVLESIMGSTKTRSYMKKDMGTIATTVFVDNEEKLMVYTVDY